MWRRTSTRAYAAGATKPDKAPVLTFAEEQLLNVLTDIEESAIRRYSETGIMPERGKGLLLIHEERGGLPDVGRWDPANADQVNAARERFAELKENGTRSAFALDLVKGRGRPLETSDPSVQQ